jgi:hypothetical protein
MRPHLGFITLLLSSCAAVVRSSSVCTIDGGAAPNVPLTLQASFGISGCASPDARCQVSLDGGALRFDTAATLCSTGCSPGGVGVAAACAVPPLAPGTYPLPGGDVLVVNVDGGARRASECRARVVSSATQAGAT